LLLGRGRTFTDEEADMLLDAPQGRQIMQMTKYSAVGTPATVRDYLDRFVRHADADELIVASGVVDRASWLRSYELLAEATGLRSEEHATSAV
jgi:alkanesulfonate monooxygenase SsuD/methylene tetrahydromethanopterin reductase-like flavin-dependent oxidoreductase (luciferase family)